MPYGAKTSDADPKKALAVRQAMADLVDRQAISDQVYKGTYKPLYSYVPTGLTGATEALKPLYGDGNGGPSADKAKQVLADAGVTTPVDAATCSTTPTTTVPARPTSTAWSRSARVVRSVQGRPAVHRVRPVLARTASKDVYPVYQLGWFPDYSDADNYLTPFFSKNNFLSNHYDNPTIQKLITEQAGPTDKAARTKLIEQIQGDEAKDLSDPAAAAGCAGRRGRPERDRSRPDARRVVQVPLRGAVQELITPDER